MPVPNSFVTTADRVTFLDYAGDELIIRAWGADADGMGAAIKINTQDADDSGPIIYVPIDCVSELIESLQHLKQRVLELSEQRTAGIATERSAATG